ncbi:hypothetical protein QUA71_12960 [Microcoleus sp. MON1_C5]|uniref:hypothetical protein n=1 Tax=Microcoleus sp. MON1_C5 TaxID=2818828 RepID=UPI002FCE88BB
MLSNLLDNSYSAANVNKFQLDRPKTCRFCTKTDYLAPRPRYKTLLLTRSRLIGAIPYPSGTPAGNGIASFHAFLSDGSHNSQILFYET